MTSPFRRFSARPAPTGLYDDRHEHDSCGVAFVATMRGAPGHDIVDLALTALRNLEHRGAVGSEPDTGDGSGILRPSRSSDHAQAVAEKVRGVG